MFITIPGIPVAKGRPRIGTVGGKARAFTPAKTVAYEGMVALAGQEAMAGTPPMTGPVRLTVVAYFPIAASWSKRKKAEAKWHTSRPDGDNILKAIGDALNAVCWADDSQIVDARVRKLYGEIPRVEVRIEAL